MICDQVRILYPLFLWNNPYLTGKWFSGVCKSQGEIEVDVLIGSDYLWNFDTGDTKRGRARDPVA